MERFKCQQCKVIVTDLNALQHYRDSWNGRNHDCFSFEAVKDKDRVWVFTKDYERGGTLLQVYDLVEVIEEQNFSNPTH